MSTTSPQESGGGVGSVFGKGGDRTTATLSDASGSLVSSATDEFEVAVTLKDDRREVLGTVETPPDEPDVSAQLYSLLERLRMLVVMLPVLAGHLY